MIRTRLAGLALALIALPTVASAAQYSITFDGLTGTFEVENPTVLPSAVTSFSFTREGITYDTSINSRLRSSGTALTGIVCTEPDGGSCLDFSAIGANGPIAQGVQCSTSPISGGFNCDSADFAFVYVIIPPGTPATLNGFYPPVDPPSIATNAAKAGQTIPLKFYAETADGPILDLTTVDITVAGVNCDDIDEGIDPLESYTTGTGDALQNLGGGSYQYNWKTIKGETGCKVVTLSLPEEYDADSLIATFKFKK